MKLKVTYKVNTLYNQTEFDERTEIIFVPEAITMSQIERIIKNKHSYCFYKDIEVTEVV